MPREGKMKVCLKKQSHGLVSVRAIFQPRKALQSMTVERGELKRFQLGV